MSEWDDLGELDNGGSNDFAKAASNDIDRILKGGTVETDSNSIDQAFDQLNLSNVDNVEAYRAPADLTDLDAFDDVSALVDAAELADELYDIEDDEATKALKNKYNQKIEDIASQIQASTQGLGALGTGTAAGVGASATTSGSIGDALTSVNKLMAKQNSSSTTTGKQQTFTGTNVSEAKIAALKKNTTASLQALVAHWKDVVAGVRASQSLPQCVSLTAVTIDLRAELHDLDKLVVEEGELPVVLTGGLPKVDVGALGDYKTSFSKLVVAMVKIIQKTEAKLVNTPNSESAKIIRIARLVAAIKKKITKEK